MLTPEQREAYETQGLLHLPAAFPDASAMEARVWELVAALHGVDRDDPETWRGAHASGMQPHLADPVFAPIGGATTTAALDELLGPGRWKRPRHWGQFLVTYPSGSREWSVPREIWHTDYGFETPSGDALGALVFSFLSDVPPRSGGTAVVTGSHRLMQRFVTTQPPDVLARMKRARKAFMRSDPWLVALATDTGPDRNARFMQTGHEVAGIRLRVPELTGQAGDVVIGHPWLLHASTMNCIDRPRIMRVQRVRVPEG